MLLFIIFIQTDNCIYELTSFLFIPFYIYDKDPSQHTKQKHDLMNTTQKTSWKCRLFDEKINKVWLPVSNDYRLSVEVAILFKYPLRNRCCFFRTYISVRLYLVIVQHEKENYQGVPLLFDCFLFITDPLAGVIKGMLGQQLHGYTCNTPLLSVADIYFYLLSRITYDISAISSNFRII